MRLAREAYKSMVDATYVICCQHWTSAYRALSLNTLPAIPARTQVAARAHDRIFPAVQANNTLMISVLGWKRRIVWRRLRSGATVAVAPNNFAWCHHSSRKQ